MKVVVVSKDNSDKQGDADVLHAQDIVPPYNDTIRQKRDSQKPEADKKESTSLQNQRKQSSENVTSPLAENKVERANDVPPEAADVGQKKSQIPKFDLAEEIMAEQRRITAIRRKAPPKASAIEAGLRRAQSSRVAGPDKKTEARLTQGRDSILQRNRKMGAQPIGYTIKQPPVLSEQEQIIAEIVTRDIERLCGRLDA